MKFNEQANQAISSYLGMIRMTKKKMSDVWMSMKFEGMVEVSDQTLRWTKSLVKPYITVILKMITKLQTVKELYVFLIDEVNYY